MPKSNADKIVKAENHAKESAEAAARIVAAIEAGEAPSLADAKILEAAGCYIRRNAVAK
jgi:hypothetical protein